MIKDSGARTEFDTGAVRDVQSLEKGRFDLMPLGVMAKSIGGIEGAMLESINFYVVSGDINHLYSALGWLQNILGFETEFDMWLEIAIHMAEGAYKYGDRNWQKGIPTERYIDSAVRHFCKHMKGDTDERHDRACLWNIACCIWTAENMPSMESFPIKLDKE